MRVAYWNPDPLPSHFVRTQQLLWTLVELAKFGITIELFSPVRWGERRSRRERDAMIERFYGLPPTSLSGLQHRELVVPPLPSTRYHFARRAVYGLRAGPTLRGGGYDLVYTRDLLALTGCLASGLPVVLETYRANLNWLRRFGPWRRLVYRQRHLLGVLLHSRYALSAFAAAGIEPERLQLAYNGYAPEHLRPERSVAEARAHLALPEHQPLVVYLGSFAPGKGADACAAVAARVPRATFLLVGAEHAGESRRLAHVAAEAGATNLRLAPRVSPAETGPYLQAADVLLIPPTGTPLARGFTVLPLKTFLYLGAGRAIVAPDLPDTREVLRHGENAVLVAPDDPAGCAAAIEALLDDPERRVRIGERAGQDAAAYTWQRRAATVAGFLTQVRAQYSPGSNPPRRAPTLAAR